MPTKAELPLPDVAYQQSISWTDALPVCRDSAVGTSTNQIYRQNGQRQEGGQMEDSSCHVRVELEGDGAATYLYGVYDGSDGTQAANFALQRMAAEILLDGQLHANDPEENVKHLLRQAFSTVEKTYWDSLGDKLAERTCVQCEIPSEITPFEAYQKYPHLVNKLDQLNTELLSGTTAVVALVHEDRLYVANVGDSRALLCRTDTDGVLRVVQLSVDHDIHNQDELLRLHNLGLKTDQMRLGALLGSTMCTRCIGNYHVKGGYRDTDGLSAAVSEPVIAEPDVHGGVSLDESCRFLLLMSDGLYRSLQAATGRPDSVNKEIVQMVVEQATLTGVAQAVVDRVARVHHDMYVDGGEYTNRDDITLLLRNFNYPMPNAISNNPLAVRFNPVVSAMALEPVAVIDNQMEEEESTINSQTTSDTCTSATTDSSDTNAVAMSQDPPSRIKPYVDFSEYYRNFDIARQNGTLPPGLKET